MSKIVSSWVHVMPLVALLVAMPSQALYKVVGPDGRVTYTDTPPQSSSAGKVTTLGGNVSVIQQSKLPAELQQAASRYPVTLYTMKMCTPCDTARQLLRQRGVPFNEKLVVTAEDGDALQRLSGARSMPTLSIGSQVLTGLASDTWNSYLDTAGYPRESHLPANYEYPAATPLTEPPALQAAPTRRPAPTPAPEPQPSTDIPAPSGIRF